MNPVEPRNYWDVLAGQFQHQQPPLRPSAEDVRIYRQAIHRFKSQAPGSPISALLLGVTPEIATLDWPPEISLLAVEKSQPMIDRFWPGDTPGRRQVVRENWFGLSLPENSVDLVIGDGMLTSLSYPDQYRTLAKLISRWMKPGGLLVLRVFARPAKVESLDDIVADLQANRIPRFDILKWRLAMLLQKDIGTGVVLNDVYQAWAAIEREHPLLLTQAGWPRATMDTIRLYEGRMERYTFPTVAELEAVFHPELQRLGVTIPDYDFGACCPIISWRCGD